MNRDYELLSTAEFEDTAHYARTCQVKFEDIQYRVRRQRQVVLECAERLGNLVNAHAWENAETPKTGREARQACAEAAEDYEDELRLLNALETAGINAREEAATAGRKVFGVLGAIVASQIGGDDIKETINEDTAIDNTVAA